MEGAWYWRCKADEAQSDEDGARHHEEGQNAEALCQSLW